MVDPVLVAFLAQASSLRRLADRSPTGPPARRVLGAIADAHGVAATLLTIGGLTLVSTLIGLTLPAERRAAQVREAVA